MNNEECKVRPEIVNVNSNVVVRNLNAKVFNLMSVTNEMRHTEWQETCKCKCRLNASVCNNKQRWIEEKKDKIKEHQRKRYQQLIQYKKKRYKINEFCFCSV